VEWHCLRVGNRAALKGAAPWFPKQAEPELVPNF